MLSALTLCTPLADIDDYRSTDVVKLVMDRDGRALYFSRAPIPARAHGAPAESPLFRHVGLYAYRVGALQTLAATPPCALELAESREQLRALWLGMRIRVAVSEEPLAPDVDTPEDIDRLASWRVSH